ncbi:sugar transferase [Rhodococcoides kyotonense]|uniref:sugar transferase n=1 Tax=Rhodococcoides kyotonense TaxID=398843 RepID=UPI000B771237|nr:sugar transferase [Rhodococcus kyotonensis]
MHARSRGKATHLTSIDRELRAPSVPGSLRGQSRAEWQRRYSRRLVVSDTIVVVASVAAAHFVRFGADTDSSYVPVTVGLIAGWLIALAAFRSRSTRIVGAGPDEYRLVLTTSFRLFGLLAIGSLLLQMDVARGYLAIAFPLGTLGLLVTRRAWRKHLVRERGRGLSTSSLLVVGSPDAAAGMIRSLERDRRSGYRVVGYCAPNTATAPEFLTVHGRSIPLLGDENTVLDAVRASGADTVAVTATEHLGPVGIRKMLWALEPHDVDLVVAPGVMDVAGSRLVMRPAADIPLINVEKPQYDGAAKFTKSAFDILFALGALVVAAPVMLVIAVAVKCTSPGPVFHRSERMGLDGKPFEMIKFRSMVVDAESHLEALLSQNDSDGGVLFKMKDDPRVTRVGRVIRRLSLDELPQFLNVLKRDMSVVGPRPPLRREVDGYDIDVRRRLLVKPGVTGLWQVSGRSDLSWEESVRLDLSYVENWSMSQDLLIIARTVRAVTRSEGAY